MRAKVEREWDGQDAYVIGGGHSLVADRFDFSFLMGKRTLGVNDAFRLGPSCCERVIFGDGEWWSRSKYDLQKYNQEGGLVYSISPDTEIFHIEWLLQMRRMSLGLSHLPDVLAWNYNTGAAAVNLAFLLGASRIYMLGFDMASVKGRTHWHTYRAGQTTDSSFGWFLRGFRTMYERLKEYPGMKVINVTNGASKLPWFERASFSEVMEKEATCVPD